MVEIPAPQRNLGFMLVTPPSALYRDTSAAHASVVRPVDLICERPVPATGSAGVDRNAHRAVGLRPDGYLDVGAAPGAADQSARTVLDRDLDPLVVGSSDRRVPRTVESAPGRRGRIRRWRRS